MVKRYSLQEAPFRELRESAIPCFECNPSEEVELVFPEKDRHWAQVSDESAAVLDALYKYDENGARYLTSVAKRLLQEASLLDKKIAETYNVEIIP